LPRTEKSKGRSENDLSSRELILRAVGELMAEQQSVDVSLSEVGKKSGLNPALVNYYFGSKSRMMMELVLEAIGPSVKRLDELLEMDIPAEEKIELHVKAIVSTFFDYPFVNRLLHRVSRTDQGQFAKELADEIVTPMHKAQRQIIQQGVREGKFRDVNPMFFFFIVTGACDAIFHSRYALRHTFGRKTISKKLMSEYTNEIVEMVLNGISA